MYQVYNYNGDGGLYCSCIYPVIYSQSMILYGKVNEERYMYCVSMYCGLYCFHLLMICFPFYDNVWMFNEGFYMCLVHSRCNCGGGIRCDLYCYLSSLFLIIKLK